MLLHSSFLLGPWVSAPLLLLACSQLDRTSKWALVPLRWGESAWESFRYSLHISHTHPIPPSIRPLEAFFFFFFGVWVKEEEWEFFSFQTESSVAFQNIYTETNNDEHGTIGVAATQLRLGVSSLYLLLFLNRRTLEPRGGAPQSKPQEKTTPPWYPDCAIYYIWRMFNQHSWLFS